MDILQRDSSKFEEKFSIKIPEKENDMLTIATRLLEKRREMREMDHALYSQKEEFKMKMESFKIRREDLDKKEMQLSESLIKFDKFLKENESKRNRAMQKAILEREIERDKALEILDLKQTKCLYDEKKDKLKMMIERYKICQKCIENVIDVSEEFMEIREIMDRYATLMSAREDLLERNKMNQTTFEEDKQNLKLIKEKRYQEVLQRNNRLAKLQLELGQLQSVSLEKSVELNELISKAAEKTLTFGRIKMATNNIYLISQKYLGNEKSAIKVVDTIKQLEKVSIFLQDLNNVVNQAKQCEINDPNH